MGVIGLARVHGMRYQDGSRAFDTLPTSQLDIPLLGLRAAELACAVKVVALPQVVSALHTVVRAHLHRRHHTNIESQVELEVGKRGSCHDVLMRMMVCYCMSTACKSDMTYRQPAVQLGM